MSRKNIVFKVITIVVVVITLVLAVYIMVNRRGVVEDYDFGAGAYYYADIPTEQYNEIVNEDAYHNTIPQWIYYVFFFAWGWLMWRLWVWIEGQNEARKK